LLLPCFRTHCFPLDPENLMSKAKKKPFLTDVKTLRARARKNMEEGAITKSYGADREKVVRTNALRVFDFEPAAAPVAG